MITPQTSWALHGKVWGTVKYSQWCSGKACWQRWLQVLGIWAFGSILTKSWYIILFYFTTKFYFIFSLPVIYFTWRWSKTLLLKIQFTFVTLTAKSITILPGSSAFAIWLRTYCLFSVSGRNQVVSLITYSPNFFRYCCLAVGENHKRVLKSINICTYLILILGVSVNMLYPGNS